MKKKGLIVATIVMVLVLAVSLTTATYAWFSTSSVTKLESFNVSVTSNNAVKIGLRTTNTLTADGSTVADSEFVSGACTYSYAGTPGAYESAGTWTGEINGLSATVTNNILWGAQSKAVAACTNGTTKDSSDTGDYTEIGTALAATSLQQINAANLKSGTLLENVQAAIANGDEANSQNADYVHFVLGVSPTKALDDNDLVIMLDWSGSQTNTLGILAALHVAYRTKINSANASAWTDVRLLGTAVDSVKTAAASGTTVYADYSTAKTGSVTTNIVDGTSAGQPLYATTYGQTYTTTGTAIPVPATSYALIIGGFSQTVGAIDEIELIIYLDGNDSSCIQAGTGASGIINIFFSTDVKA